MRWNTPTVTDNGLYLVKAMEEPDLLEIFKGRTPKRFITYPERSWLLENDITICYSSCWGAYEIDMSKRTTCLASHIVLPKKLAVEFVLRFG